MANRKNRKKLGDRLFADAGEKEIATEDNLKAMLKHAKSKATQIKLLE